MCRFKFFLRILLLGFNFLFLHLFCMVITDLPSAFSTHFSCSENQNASLGVSFNEKINAEFDELIKFLSDSSNSIYDFSILYFESEEIKRVFLSYVSRVTENYFSRFEKYDNPAIFIRAIENNNAFISFITNDFIQGSFLYDVQKVILDVFNRYTSGGNLLCSY